MKWLKRLWPQRMATRLILLLLFTLVLTQIISFAIFTGERRSTLIEVARSNALWRTASIVHLLEETPPSLQRKLLKATSNARTKYWVAKEPILDASGDERMEKNLANFLQRRMKDDRPIYVVVHKDRDDFPNIEERFGRVARSQPPEDRGHRHRVDRRWDKIDPGIFSLQGVTVFASLQLNDGSWLNLESNFKMPKRPLAPILAPILFLAVAIVIIIGPFVWLMMRPLRDLSEAAEQLGKGQEVATLRVAGPLEVRSTIIAFNQMQDRLTRFVKDRTRMLAAISHDLRTPITSLRIRAEFIEDDEDRERMIATLDEMQAMTEATLAFARDEATTEQPRNVDLGGLLETIATDYEDIGSDVKARAEDRIILSCRLMSLKRALRNIIDNALRYGGNAEVELKRSGDTAIITISDDGPGIPEERMTDVFEPFVRLEESRNEDTGGIGLGLAICRSIIHAHGGTITLANKQKGTGLIVVIQLPI
ncbi:HAMP domain-containing protein [Rhodobacteraceae bacterium RKSG542]|nr:HAMP domain-containing protein [Pseudovibrio flavus]